MNIQELLLKTNQLQSKTRFFYEDFYIFSKLPLEGIINIKIVFTQIIDKDIGNIS